MPLEKPLKQQDIYKYYMATLLKAEVLQRSAGKEGERFEGTARVFDGEHDLIRGIQSGKVHAGDVVVIRNIGPKGAPGMPEMLKPTGAIIGAGLGKTVALITDGRFQRRNPWICCWPYHT